jgi:predicted Zn-dependent peptidase
MIIGERISELLSSISSGNLENGLKFILIEKHDLPLVSFYIFYKTGSRNEIPGKRGISHFLEHLMFNETENLAPREFDRILEENGGDSNAYTSQDWTAYYEEFQADALEKVIDMEAERMKNLKFVENSIESERNVIMEERRYRTENLPYGIQEEALYSLSYLEHPYRFPVIGYMEDILNIKSEDLENYYKSYYVPNNALIVISGDIKKEEVEKIIREKFGGIADFPVPSGFILREKTYIGERRGLIVHDVEVPSLMISYLSCEAENRDSIPLDILQIILASGRSSRLYRELVLESLHAVSISAEFPWRFDPSLFTIHCVLKENERVESVEEIIYSEIEKLKRGDIKGEEIQKAKNIIFTEFVRGFQTNSGIAHMIGSYELLLGEWRKLFDILEEYEKIEKDWLTETAQRYFTEDRRTVVAMVPLKYKREG